MMALLCRCFSSLCLAQNYIIQDSVMIKTPEGQQLSAVVVRKAQTSKPLPTALMFFIYSNTDRSIQEAKYAADKGYVGVVADTRGKRLSPDTIEPYENEVKDVNAVIGWIIQQPWSNGEVGMYGGSYSGFAQWAALKNPHPALKTIVPYVAAIPGQGLPMENNIFLNANYQWAFYVTNNKYTDDKVNADHNRWHSMRNNWFNTGAAYNKIDSVDGTKNPWLQKWLQHPSYDHYWQSMVPYRKDFAKINIPVLSITGYYDDGQISALQYLTEHYKYNPKANHYLIIGPYDHFGAQKGGSRILRGYQVDSIALINTREITFEWLDYILKDGSRPSILKDKINYQVMGSNEWQHQPSISKMSDKRVKLYLETKKIGNDHILSSSKPKEKGYLKQVVNLADRETTNNDYYPDPIIRDELDKRNGLFFRSDRFDRETSINGFFSGRLSMSINKKDMDIGVVLYELTAEGKYFQLSYFLGRASYLRDATKRHLLRVNKKESLPFEKSRLISKKLEKGSRLVVVLNIDKNPFAQVNYGTGKDVSKETIQDAKSPLEIKWFNDSFIEVPIRE